MNKIQFLSILLIFILFFFSCSKKTELPIEYSKPVKYSKNTPVQFPDFDITYIGERKESIPFHDGKEITIIYHDFKINNDKYYRTVTWTSGTGDIAPEDFEFNGMKFRLELRYFEKEKRKLENGELVVT